MMIGVEEESRSVNLAGVEGELGSMNLIVIKEEPRQVNQTTVAGELGLANLSGMEKDLASVKMADVGEDSVSVITGLAEEPGSINLDVFKEEPGSVNPTGTYMYIVEEGSGFVDVMQLK